MISIFDYILFNGLGIYSLTQKKDMDKVVEIARKLKPLAKKILNHRDGLIIVKEDNSIKIIGFKDEVLKGELQDVLGIK